MSRHVVYQTKLMLRTSNEAVEHVKWCRRNLGERGSDWDFFGSMNLVIVIYNPKYATFYILKFG